jgi:hypothetical protein
MLLQKSRFTIALLWAMIPLTVFGSQPRMGCICANGQHKLFCQRHLQRDTDRRCTCCYGKDTADPAADDGVQGPRKASCCACNGTTGKSDRPSVQSDRPCRPVLDKTIYLTGPKWSLDLDRLGAAPLFLAFESRPVIERSIVAGGHRGELLPPPDLVVTLGVLLI